MAREHRLTRMDALLRRPQGATMAQMMDDLQVSRATVNRDLQFLRDHMHAPIVWDAYGGVYRLETNNSKRSLPGLWLTPQQAYAFLTLQNMVEKIAPNLLGPFLDPMRGLLKEMLGRANFELYGLDKKIDINMPAMPDLGDLDFNNLLDALLHDQPICLTLHVTHGTNDHLVGVPVRLRIAPNQWVIDFRPEFEDAPIQIDVSQIRKVAIASEERMDRD